ncbi:hypothetical protein [Nocardia sp. NPDC004123]
MRSNDQMELLSEEIGELLHSRTDVLLPVIEIDVTGTLDPVNRLGPRSLLEGSAPMQDIKTAKRHEALNF